MPSTRSTARRRPTTAKQAEKRDAWDALKAKLEADVTQLCESEQFKAALQMAAKFHNYSLANCLLIYVQCPTATRVAGYEKWKELGRQVRKGESSIRIWGHPVYKKNEKGKDEFAYWPMVSVFDIAQTDGDPLPEPPSPVELQGETVISWQGADRLTGWLEESGIRVMQEEMTGTLMGYYHPHHKLIAMRAGLPANQYFKTLVHEAAHFVAQHVGGTPSDVAETVAEGAAYLVCGRLGFDTSQYTVPYIAGWAKDPKVLRANLGEMTSTARLLSAVLEQRAQVELQPA